jgi:hypothetical protein
MNQKGKDTCSSAKHGFWPVEELKELTDGLVCVCSDVGNNGCLFTWNFSVTRPTVLSEGERRPRPKMVLH